MSKVSKGKRHANPIAPNRIRHSQHEWQRDQISKGRLKPQTTFKRITKNKIWDPIQVNPTVMPSRMMINGN